LSSIVPNLHRKLYIFFNTTIMIQLIFYQPWLSPHFQHHTKSSHDISSFHKLVWFILQILRTWFLLGSINSNSVNERTWVITNLQYRQLVSYIFDEITFHHH
jgi:hypothetical protein